MARARPRVVHATRVGSADRTRTGSAVRAGVGVLAGILAVLAGPARAEDDAVADAALRRLRGSLERILEAPQLDGALTGVHVRRLSDGKTLFERNGDKLFNPASNMKLLTTAAALWYLGPTYTFRTHVRRAPEMTEGVVKGDLFVEAKGDPTLTTEAMFGLANDVAMSGVRVVEGDLVVDDRFFDAVTEGPGWEQEVGDHTYNAPVGAFSANFNTFEARVTPGDFPGAPARLALWPDVPSLTGEITATTSGPGTLTRLWFGTTRTDDDGVQVTIRGTIAADDAYGRTLRRRIHDPFTFTGEMLLRVLALRGVEVKGKLRRGEMDVGGTVPVATRYSEPLAEIISVLNKYSNNFVAEQILKTLAAELEGPPGTWESGARVLSRFLTEVGIREGAYVLGNGSGLNDVNRVTPEQITRVLDVMHDRFELRAEYVASLAVAGSSGTIVSRFEDSVAISRLRAKTGSLTGVSALSGYVVTQDEEVLAFSVMMNDYPGRASAMWTIQDRIGIALAEMDGLEAVSLSEPRPRAGREGGAGVTAAGVAP